MNGNTIEINQCILLILILVVIIVMYSIRMSISSLSLLSIVTPPHWLEVAERFHRTRRVVQTSLWKEARGRQRRPEDVPAAAATAAIRPQLSKDLATAHRFNDAGYSDRRRRAALAGALSLFTWPTSDQTLQKVGFSLQRVSKTD